MSGGPWAGGNLPWKLEVMLLVRGLQGGEQAQPRKASWEGPGAARGSLPGWPLFICLPAPSPCSPPCVLNPESGLDAIPSVCSRSLL